MKDRLKTISVRIPPAVIGAFEEYVEEFNRRGAEHAGVPHRIGISAAYRLALEQGLGLLWRALPPKPRRRKGGVR